ncbi:anaerobic ribonucleoside-triphosphate reductase activating protein [Clostridiales bacterium COT073_COT-073]|nr:anaerobic ribonucleoside-triphosphate reductase activating protein [Clostridiales bacterium COT073_COT-073]
MRYHNITKDDMNNGEGLRVVLWLAGCTHACPGCHNPVTWDIDGGLYFDQAAKAELWEVLARDYIDGITLSGGDPLHPHNREELNQLLAEITEHFPEKSVWLYTGYRWEEIKDLPLLQYVDILIDGRFEQDKFSPELPWVGSYNQRVIDVNESLHCADVVIYQG